MNTVHLMGYRIFLSLILNELLQSEIVHKLTSFQKITCISVITDKKINFTFYISSVVFHLSLWFKLDSFFSLVLFSAGILLSAGIHKRRGKKGYWENN